MKKKIVITENDGIIEIEKFLDNKKVEGFEDSVETGALLKIAMHQNKRDAIKNKKKTHAS